MSENISSNKHNLFLSKVPQHVKREELLRLFKTFGKILNLKLRSKCPNMPKIGLLTVGSKKVLDLILWNSPFTSSCGSLINVERQLTGKELEVKETSIKNKRISVLGIYGSISNERLKRKFSIFGEVDIAYCRYYEDNPHKAIGFVTFFDSESAMKALAYKRIKINSKNARIQKFVKKNDSKKRAKNYPGAYESSCTRGYELVDPFDERELKPELFNKKQRGQEMNYSGRNSLWHSSRYRILQPSATFRVQNIRRKGTPECVNSYGRDHDLAKYHSIRRIKGLWDEQGRGVIMDWNRRAVVDVSEHLNMNHYPDNLKFN